MWSASSVGVTEMWLYGLYRGRSGSSDLFDEM